MDVDIDIQRRCRYRYTCRCSCRCIIDIDVDIDTGCFRKAVTLYMAVHLLCWAQGDGLRKSSSRSGFPISGCAYCASPGGWRLHLGLLTPGTAGRDRLSAYQISRASAPHVRGIQSRWPWGSLLWHAPPCATTG